MPATNRSSGFLRAVALLVPLSAALGGCVAVPLLELAASSASPTTPCATNASADPVPGCNAGATGSMIPGMASLMQVFAPATSPSQ
jgi:hypothetical protein